MRFTIQLRGEIGHQLVKAPMAAAISLFMITTMNTCEQARPQQRGLRPLLFSNSDVGSLTSPTNILFNISIFRGKKMT